MLNTNDELENYIKRILRSHKIRYRSLSIEDEKVIIGIEGYKRDFPYIINKLKTLKLYPTNIIYGKWTFRRG